MEDNKDRIRFADLLRAGLHLLPELPRSAAGLYNMARLKPGSTYSIGLRLQELAARQPRAIALRFESRSWTYEEFNAWVNRIAHTLQAAGLRRGEAVGVLMENRAETLACVAAVVKLGAVAAMLNPQQRGAVLTHSMSLANPRALIVGEECQDALASSDYAAQQQGALQLWWEGEAPAPAGFADLRRESAQALPDNPPQTAQIRLSEACFFIFTSGTTGLPKASRMSHYRWTRGMAGMGQLALRLRADDVLYCPLPLYHNNALTVSWGSVLGAGATLALGRKFSASRFWDEIRRFDASAFCYIGELCRYLLNQPPSAQDRQHRVRAIVGNGLRPELWDAFQQRFGIAHICEFYGASEANLAFVNGLGLPRTAGYCPLAFAIVEYDTAADEPRRGADGHLRRVAKGGVGLLITEVSERAPFDGYVAGKAADNKANEAKLLRDVFKRGDCWFNSGDLVRDQGFRHIQFVDRVGDTFRWKGENVSTTEVEGAINRFAGISEAVVYGVQLPGAEGRAGMAALTPEGELDRRALAQHLCAQLPPYAVPLFLRLRQSQETTATFKFRKVDLKSEGFDPQRTADPLYVLLDRQVGYEPLTPALHAQIVSGQLRF
ncbi:fatty-acyl-CoA synthase [Solimonas aquatica]|uniref:Fatty-acyl-CoA synthase n=1 Tax=Solimonas aquatica TaxID=489703 RepID=A0A1H9D207_9GAMM|nr:long-chain-acyl-CoA synthetase [Solimonas aquatica]SEQ07397.1 fatty-acyl-CoA synthase [Solimonas aquatica]